MPDRSDQAVLESLALGDHYTVDRVLGRGGMATVYLARDLKHDRSVAVKVLRPEVLVGAGVQRCADALPLQHQAMNGARRRSGIGGHGEG